MLRSRFQMVATALGLVVLSSAHTAAAQARRSELERRLIGEARLEWLTELALAQSPVLAEAAARMRSAHQRASASGRLPDPEFKYEQWATPLRRPYALDRADMLMFGLRQSFPAAGSRSAQERATMVEAEMAAQQRSAVERELVRRVRQAYFDFFAAEQTLALYEEHVAIAEQMLGQLRANYELGRGSQQEMLSALVELSRLHNRVIDGKQQRASGRFLLNTLMGRAADAPLGPAVALESKPVVAPSLQSPAQQVATGRPEVALAHAAVRRSEASAEVARHTARRPTFMVGADYWLMPSEASMPAYGAMVSMSLPWLNPEHRARARAAEQIVEADRHAAQSARLNADLELHRARAALEAAQGSLDILERELLPQADKSLDAARSSFALGHSSLLGLLDALRSHYDLRLEHSRAFARVMSQLAELEFTSGARIFGVVESSERSHER